MDFINFWQGLLETQNDFVDSFLISHEYEDDKGFSLEQRNSSGHWEELKFTVVWFAVSVR